MYWEHTHHNYLVQTDDNIDEEINRILANHERDGYELVTVLAHEEGYEFYFKRPANQEDYHLPPIE